MINEQEYRLEMPTGEVYSKDEFMAHYSNWLYNDETILKLWDMLEPVEVPEGALEEVKKKLRAIYKPDESKLSFGRV